MIGGISYKNIKKKGHTKMSLQAAAYSGDLEAVKLLLDRGADVNIQAGKHGTALQAAASKGYQDIVKLLLDHDAEVNILGGYYGNALQAAVIGQNTRLRNYFLTGEQMSNIQ